MCGILTSIEIETPSMKLYHKAALSFLRISQVIVCGTGLVSALYLLSLSLLLLILSKWPMNGLFPSSLLSLSSIGRTSISTPRRILL